MRNKDVQFCVLLFIYVLNIVPSTNYWKFPGKILLIGLYLSYTVIVSLWIDHNRNQLMVNLWKLKLIKVITNQHLNDKKKNLNLFSLDLRTITPERCPWGHWVILNLCKLPQNLAPVNQSWQSSCFVDFVFDQVVEYLSLSQEFNRNQTKHRNKILKNT